MNKTEAIRKAQKIAKDQGKDMYVIYEGWEQGYLIGDDYDLDTFFSGAVPVFCIEPDGTINI